MADAPAVTAEPPKESFALQVLDKVGALMTAAFALIAALAWNDAIKGIITAYLPAGSGLRAQMIYAIIVTVIAVLAGLWIAAATTRVKKRLRRERKAEREEQQGGQRQQGGVSGA